MTSDGRFQILALDGGGIKGLFSAAVLAAIEDDLNINLTDHFDLIAGTSTGGIIALALGLGLRPRQIVEFYEKHGPAIFRDNLRLRCAWSCVRSKFSSEPLKRALRDPSALGERLFGESRKRLIIPAYNLGADDVYLFRTAHHADLRRDCKEKAWRVAMATTAAPTYFRAFTGIDGIRLVDGGLWANNPAMAALVEAVSTLGVALSSIRLLSLGCMQSLKVRSKGLDRGGLYSWAKAGGDVLMAAQSVAIHKQVCKLLPKNAVLRIDPHAPDGLFAMDRAKLQALKAKAAHDSRQHIPTFKSMFADHDAPPFVPIHQAVKEASNAG